MFMLLCDKFYNMNVVIINISDRQIWDNSDNYL